MKEYIKKFNKRFAVKPENDNKVYQTQSFDLKLKHILCLKEQRKLDNGNCFSYKGNIYQVMNKEKKGNIPLRATINVLESKKIGLKVEYENKIYETSLFKKSNDKKTA